jgi:hypothetical protein
MCECYGRYMQENYCRYQNCLDPQCSGYGACNIKTGKCSCDDGRFGEICQFKYCQNNCSLIGVCDVYNGTCICPVSWTGEDCSINTHVLDLQLVNSISSFIGSTFIVLTALTIATSSFLLQRIRSQKIVVVSGYTMMLLDILQFIAISGIIGENSPPDYLKFAAAFIWSNFLFDIDLRARSMNPTSPTINVVMQEKAQIGTSSDLIRKMLNQKGEILFLNNFILVCIVCILTLILFGLVAAYHNIRSSSEQETDQLAVSESTRRALSMGLVRLALICYLGVSVSVMYEIALAFQGQIIFVTLLVSVALLIGYLIGVPTLLALILTNNRKNLDNADFTTQIGPLYEDFKKEFYLFMIVIQGKKLLMGTLIGLFQASPLDQLIGLVIILLVYALVVIVLKPFKAPMRNVMEFIMTVVQIFVVIMLLFCSAKVVISHVAQLVFSIIMISVVSLFLLISAMIMLKELCDVDLVPELLGMFFKKLARDSRRHRRESRKLLSPSDDEDERELENIQEPIVNTHEIQKVDENNNAA